MRSETDEKGGESVGNPWGIVGNRISNRGIRAFGAQMLRVFCVVFVKQIPSRVTPL